MCKQKWNLYKPNPAACKAGPVPINTQENMEYDPVSTCSISRIAKQYNNNTNKHATTGTTQKIRHNEPISLWILDACTTTKVVTNSGHT